MTKYQVGQGVFLSLSSRYADNKYGDQLPIGALGVICRLNLDELGEEEENEEEHYVYEVRWGSRQNCYTASDLIPAEMPSGDLGEWE